LQHNKTENYRNEKELNYYGSDYNKFLRKECSKKMTVNNIDVVQYKNDFKSKTETIRIVESKHGNESFGTNQEKILQILARAFKYLNGIQKKYIFQVYIVRGDPPFEKTIITDLINDKTFNVDKKELINFSEFKENVTATSSINS